ncbi:MAG: hypothetical protein U9O54_06545 [Chloroflexota bacterium]|nr:hypothetical protein [Chloroflexota bacterium]
MIKHYSKNKIVTMSLVDLEHCGFDHREYAFELERAGITAEEAQWPVAFIVNFTSLEPAFAEQLVFQDKKC